MTTAVLPKHQMTVEEAQSFSGFSQANAMILDLAARARGCQCSAYMDWFTYGRWQTQGMQVRKGEHGTKITVFVHRTLTDAQGKEHDKSFPRSTSVFCRCQVDEKEMPK